MPAEWEDKDDTVVSTFLSLIFGPLFHLLDKLKHENISDPFLQSLHIKNHQVTLTSPYKVAHGLLLFRGRYVISLSSQLCKLLLQEFHDTPSGGHVKIKRTLSRLFTNFFWPNMGQFDIDHIQACLLWQQVKYSTQALAGLLQPFPIPKAL